MRECSVPHPGAVWAIECIYECSVPHLGAVCCPVCCVHLGRGCFECPPTISTTSFFYTFFYTSLTSRQVNLAASRQVSSSQYRRPAPVKEPDFGEALGEMDILVLTPPPAPCPCPCPCWSWSSPKAEAKATAPGAGLGPADILWWR